MSSIPLHKLVAGKLPRRAQSGFRKTQGADEPQTPLLDPDVAPGRSDQPARAADGTRDPATLSLSASTDAPAGTTHGLSARFGLLLRGHGRGWVKTGDDDSRDHDDTGGHATGKKSDPTVTQRFVYDPDDPFARSALLGRWFPGYGHDEDDDDKAKPSHGGWLNCCGGFEAVRGFLANLAGPDASMLLQLLFASVVFLVNLASTIVLSAVTQDELAIGTIYTGDCTTSDQINSGIHLLINFLSTLLLGASNYAMQTVIAPTRQDILGAHNNRKWLDIGVSSWTNVRAAKGIRFWLWLALGFSSAGLHLLWNAAIFKAIPIQSYMVAVVTSDWQPNATPWSLPDTTPADQADWLSPIQSDMALWDRLNPAQCIAAYINPLASARRLAVVVNVTSQERPGNQNTSLIFSFMSPAPVCAWKEAAFWICRGTSAGFDGPNPLFCGVSAAAEFEDDWNIFWAGQSAHIDYCMSEATPEGDTQCAVQFSVVIMALVCFFNLVKVLSIFWIRKVFCRDQAKSLLILGDAIRDLLREPDPSTKDVCLLDVEDIRGTKRGVGKKSRVVAGEGHDTVEAGLAAIGEKRWKKRTWRAGNAIGWRQWLTFLIPSTLLILGALAIFIQAVVALGPTGVSVATALGQGLGQISLQELLGRPFADLYGMRGIGFTFSVLFANAFQLLVSFLYLLLNTLLTHFSIANEWASYTGKRRKALRVSSDEDGDPAQASLYLSLPYASLVPLIIKSSLLHFFISQAVFPIRAIIYNPDGSQDPLNDNTVVGTSVLGILLALLLAATSLAVVVSLGWLQRIESNAPMAGSCSLAIAAACHPDPRDDEAHKFPVRWILVSTKMVGNEEVGHCCFSTMEDSARPVPKDGMICR